MINRKKESKLPFPSQHPYTSHISQFSLFPDSCCNANAKQQQLHASSEYDLVESGIKDDTTATTNKVHAFTQTDHSCFTRAIALPMRDSAAPACLVKSKAFSGGARIEVMSCDSINDEKQAHSHCSNNLSPGIYRWDISRALPKRFQVCAISIAII